MKIKQLKRINFKNSQAAIDFVMTYGWAIMMVIVAIGALAYFGVLSPDKLVGEKCVFPSGISCLDQLASGVDQAILVTIKNNLGHDITGISVIATGCTVADSQSSLRNGQTVEFTPSGCAVTAGQKYNGQVNITYTNADTGITHKKQGTLITKVT